MSFSKHRHVKRHIDKRLFIEINCNNVPVKTLIDTGAECSVMGENVFKRIFENKSTRLRNSGPIFGLAGQMVETMGEVDISIQNTTISVRVSKYSNDNFDMILGMDALTPLQAKIDCEGYYITLKGHKYFNKGAFSQEFSQVAYTLPVLW